MKLLYSTNAVLLHISVNSTVYNICESVYNGYVQAWAIATKRKTTLKISNEL